MLWLGPRSVRRSSSSEEVSRLQTSAQVDHHGRRSIRKRCIAGFFIGVQTVNDEPVNPYAAPESDLRDVADQRTPFFFGTTAGEASVLTVFNVCRFPSSFFVTMIFLVHLSGTSVRWDNVVPMFAGIGVGLGVTHLLERLFVRKRQERLRRIASIVCLLSYLGGMMGALVSGLFGLFPTPFR